MTIVIPKMSSLPVCVERLEDACRDSHTLNTCKEARTILVINRGAARTTQLITEDIIKLKEGIDESSSSSLVSLSFKHHLREGGWEAGKIEIISSKSAKWIIQLGISGLMQ